MEDSVPWQNHRWKELDSKTRREFYKGCIIQTLPDKSFYFVNREWKLRALGEEVPHKDWIRIADDTRLELIDEEMDA